MGDPAAFTWLPANEATAEHVEAVLGAGGAAKCRCQGLKVEGWIWRDSTQEEREAALVAQTACGTDGPTSGLIGYVDGEPAGWVAVEPRENYPRIWSRKQPWMRMDPELEGVWSVTCFVVRKGFRREGSSGTRPRSACSRCSSRPATRSTPRPRCVAASSATT